MVHKAYYPKRNPSAGRKPILSDSSEVLAKAQVRVAKLAFTSGATYRYVSPLGFGLMLSITPDLVVFDYSPRWSWMKKAHPFFGIHPFSSVEPMWSAPRRRRWVVVDRGRILFMTPGSSLTCSFADARWTEVLDLLASSGDLAT